MAWDPIEGPMLCIDEYVATHTRRQPGPRREASVLVCASNGGRVDVALSLRHQQLRNRQITIWGAIDPNGIIAECNEGDSSDPADDAAICQDLR
jgi:hypothetical protein